MKIDSQLKFLLLFDIFSQKRYYSNNQRNKSLFINLKLINVLIFSVLTLYLFPQTQSLVSNVDWDYFPEDNTIIIKYDLNKLERYNYYEITCQGKVDNKFIPMKTIKGDVGKKVKIGIRKSITWDILKDTEELDGVFEPIISARPLLDSADPIINIQPKKANSKPSTFYKSYPSNGMQVPTNIIKNKDGNIAIVGYTVNELGSDILFVLIDGEGNKISESRFDNGIKDIGNAIQLNNRGGYAIVGTTNNGKDTDIYLVITDEHGNKIIEKTYGGVGFQNASNITVLEDGSYAIIGYTFDKLKQSDVDLYIVITDKNGNLISEKRIEEGLDEYGRSITQLEEGGFVIFGDVNNNGSDNYLYLIFIDEYLNELPYSRGKYRHTNNFFASDIVKTEGGYGLLAYNENLQKIYLMIVDKTGNMSSEKLFEGKKSHLGKYGGIDYSDNEFVITGYKTSDDFGNTTSKKVYLSKFDIQGNEMEGFPKILGEIGDQVGIDIIKTKNGYAIMGFTRDLSIGDIDILFLTTDKSGNTNNEP